MYLTNSTLRKLTAGFFVCLLALLASAPYASAQTYYYPATYTQSNAAQVQYLMNQINVLLAQLQTMQGYTGSANYHKYYYNDLTPKKKVVTYGNYNYGSYDIDVTTEDSDVESDDTVTLSGKLDLDDSPYARVWFEYGTDGDLDEESDSLRLTDDDEFDIEVNDVDTDDRYYFRAVAEAPNGERAYGSLRAFGDDRNDDDDDDDNNDDDIPDVTTDDAENIEDDRAELHGEIDMNDFDNGIAFFVYGEDEDQLMDVEDENRYNDIDEDGDDLQKVLLSSSLDGLRTFWSTVTGLNDDTDHFFRICVEYEDEDDDDVLECGDVEEFTTDN